MVRPHRTSLNHCVQVGSMPAGKVQVSSGGVRPHRTSLNHCVQVGSMPAGKVQVSSGGGSTSPNLLEALCLSGKHAYREGLSEFRVVRPHRTSLNHCVRVGSMPTGKVQVSSGWFDRTEPPQTSLNHCVQVGSMPTGKVQVSSGWFDLLEPLF